MIKSDVKVVFMGTPDFAVGILEELLASEINIQAVITAPDKPAGRGQQIQESAVKKAALSHGLHILQPTYLKDEDFINELESIQADIFVVVAFRMLPERVWNMPPKGTINLHASLLPQYRGAAPINWAVINGEKKTGVTTFFIEKEIDTGMVIERQETEIGENETAGELHDRLLEIGKKLVVKSVQQIASGEVTRTPQDALVLDEDLKAAPKIFKPMCEVNWNDSVEQVHNHCRGLSPYPTAWAYIFNPEKNEKKSLKIFTTRKTDLPVEQERKLRIDKNRLFIPCADFYLEILELQPEGKRRMHANEFIAGYSKDTWFVE